MAKARARTDDGITVAGLERDVVYLAYVVENYGDQYAPILDRLIAGAGLQPLPYPQLKRCTDSLLPSHPALM